MTSNARIDNARVIRAPRGSEISAKSWLTEAPLRMLMNNLDPEVAEKPSELIVYGGIGRAARDWQSFDRIVAALKTLEGDETLLVQSGKPVGIFRTHADAPRVLLANSNLVPHWATWDYFHELDRKGLMMYGQMTAGSWIYIGSQGIVQGTYETFVEVGRRHYGGDLSGRWILTAGLGGDGRRAAARRDNGQRFDARRRMPGEPHRRYAFAPAISTAQARDLDEALAIIEKIPRRQEAGFRRTARQRRAASFPNSSAAASNPTSSPIRRALTIRSMAICRRAGLWPEWETRRERDPKGVEKAARASMAAACAGHARFFPLRDSNARLWQQYSPDG